MEYKNYFI